MLHMNPHALLLAVTTKETMKVLHIYLNGDPNLSEVLIWGARSWAHGCLHIHGPHTGTHTESPLLMAGNFGMHQIQLGQKHVQQKQRPLTASYHSDPILQNLGFLCFSFRQQHNFIPYRTISCCVYLEIALALVNSSNDFTKDDFGQSWHSGVPKGPQSQTDLCSLILSSVQHAAVQSH